MIYVFEARLEDGRFVSSRFTSYPIPEIGIGFLSHFFGSWAANSVTFIFHLIGLVLIFLSFEKTFKSENLYFFLILCLSSPILFFENLEPIDYSWAFLFFSLGLYFFSKNFLELAILAFAFSVGCRLNFIIFVLIAIFFFKNTNHLTYYRRTLIGLCTFITSGLFYLSVWFDNGFGLGWIDAGRPIEQGIFGLLARFSYKTWMSFGIIQLFIIIFCFFKIFKSKAIFESYKLLIILTIFNLFLFLYIPAELSYLQPAIIFVYLVLCKFIDKKIISTLILLNFLSWGMNLELLKINYKDNSICTPKQAISATFDISLKHGAIHNFYDSRKMIGCWVNPNTIRGQRILNGKSTRLN